MSPAVGIGVSLMIDQTVTVGNILEMIIISGGGIGVFFTLRNTVTNINSKVDGMQIEIKKLGEILVNMARQDEKLMSLERRVTSHDRKLDELSHGEGFVRGRAGIDREYGT
jgi:ABC-type bacteriocin/lantibiotic exporter with double-glycine peptidase domain